MRVLAAEFAALHPAVARNLLLDTAPCPDPYVERLLEGVAYLAARTRLKLDAEGSRFARAVLDALYPDLVAPTPAVGMVALQPGQQVQTMRAGHVVPRGTRLVAALRPGPVDAGDLYHGAGRDPVADRDRVGRAICQDRSALAAAGIGAVDGERGEAALRLTLRRPDAALARARARPARPALSPTAPRRRRCSTRSSGSPSAPAARPAARGERLRALPAPAMIGLRDDEALMPRTRAGFEGYRLLREYFIMPERFHFARIEGLRPVVARCAERARDRLPAAPAGAGAGRPAAAGPAALRHADRQPVRARLQRRRDRPAAGRGRCVHADRTRPRDFEIYRITGSRTPTATARRRGCRSFSASAQSRGGGRSGGPSGGRAAPPRTSGGSGGCAPPTPATTSSSRSRGRRAAPAGGGRSPGWTCGRSAPTATCRSSTTSRRSALESGDPVQAVRLHGALRPPRPALGERCRRSGPGRATPTS